MTNRYKIKISGEFMMDLFRFSRRILFNALFSLALSSPLIAGNDSVALIYVESGLHSPAKKIETTLYKGKPHHYHKIQVYFLNVAENNRKIYVQSNLYKGWIENLEMVGSVIHGKTPTGTPVVIVVGGQ